MTLLASTSIEQHPSVVVVTSEQQSFRSDSLLDDEEQATEDTYTCHTPTAKITPDVDIVGSTQNNTVARRQQQLQAPPVPDDETLKHMDVILNDRLRGITLEEFFNIWNDDTDTSLYRNWLELTGKKDINIQHWNLSTDGDHASTNNNNHCWNDGESYPLQRTVTFTVARTSHLYIGPPMAAVRHVQKCRVDPNTNRCVLTMQIDMQGIPFGDCFQIHIRWVATQSQQHDGAAALDIQVGLFVHFIKSTIFAGKIRSSTREETRKTQLSLFHAIQQHAKESTTVDRVVEEKSGEECMNDDKICNNQNNNKSIDNEDGDADGDEEDDFENPSCFTLSNVCAGLFRNRHEDDSATK
ncbi:protein of unknown function (DUF4782) [Fragilaria crotonensis]|nr:protein of unknown function (DUF4782) [Fragilaria crotonensis]